MSASTRAACRSLTTGPISVAGLSGSPTSIGHGPLHDSLDDGVRDTSLHHEARCRRADLPALVKIPATTPSATTSRSETSSRTTAALLPPASIHTCLRLDWPAYCWNSRPVAVDPVKVTTSTCGCRPSARPTTGPAPGTTPSTPSGSPASAASSARRSTESGESSAGLSTTLLPAASAGASFQIAISSG